MASVSMKHMQNGSSECFSDCTQRLSLKDPELVWPMSEGLSPGTVAAPGLKVNLTRGPVSISRWEFERAGIVLSRAKDLSLKIRAVGRVLIILCWGSAGCCG